VTPVSEGTPEDPDSGARDPGLQEYLQTPAFCIAHFTEMPTPIPPPQSAEVWIDFDGTITRLDVLDELIRRFAVDDSWKVAEAEWQAGLIGSRDCLTRQLGVVAATDEQLDRFVDEIPVDVGFVKLVNLLDENKVTWTILSDGIDRFISRLTKRVGIETARFRSNMIDTRTGRLNLICPHGSPDCRSASAHCKCSSIRSLSTGKTGIYIGDGRSDLCPIRTVSCRFAKGVLAVTLEREGLSYIAFDTLDDVADILTVAWASRP
jgi:2,3-diketo-5-methylthio-1-phosphopentane phosphatase